MTSFWPTCVGGTDGVGGASGFCGSDEFCRAGDTGSLGNVDIDLAVGEWFGDPCDGSRGRKA